MPTEIAPPTPAEKEIAPPLSEMDIARAAEETLRAFTAYQPRVVRRFLLNNPHLIPVLQQSVAPKTKIFGAEAPVHIEVMPDPEGYDPPVLYAEIETAEELEAAARLSRFYVEWFQTIPETERMNLVFDLRLV